MITIMVGSNGYSHTDYDDADDMNKYDNGDYVVERWLFHTYKHVI